MVADTQKVLKWLQEALRVTDENPGNLEQLYVEVRKHDKQIEEAVIDALKPEFKDIGRTIASLIRGGS